MSVLRPGMAVICLAAGLSWTSLALGEPAAQPGAAPATPSSPAVGPTPSTGGEGKAVPKALARLAQRTDEPPPTSAEGTDTSSASSNSSDHSIRWSGSGELTSWVAIDGSMRQSIFTDNSSNSQLKLTHVHPKLTANLGPKAFAYGELCITHPHVGPQPEQAYFEYDRGERLNFQVGRFLVPFGQWNQIHDVFDHKSIAYPLMYLGHEEEDFVLKGGPQPIASTAFTDIGILGFGSFWPRPSDQLWYGAYVCNGRFGGSNIEWEDLWNNFQDNNSNKAYGGRLVWTHGDNLTIGASYQDGKYDPQNKLRYQFSGADLYYRIAKKINLRAEWVRNPVDSFTQGYTKEGWWVSADMPVSKKHEVVVTYSHLHQDPAQVVENEARTTVGFNTYLTRSLKLKTEVDYLQIGGFVGNSSSPDDTKYGTSFQNNTLFRASIVAIF
jgi:hypothetical protein